MPADSFTLPKRNEELVSDEVKEIISFRPHWFIQKGNAIFLLILLSLLSLTWFIQYPDIVNSSARPWRQPPTWAQPRQLN